MSRHRAGAKFLTMFQGEAMLRKLVGAAVLLVLCASATLADEIRAFITKVDGDKITFQENKGKGEKGDAKTMTVVEKVKIVKGKYDKDTKKIEATDEEIKDGLKNEMFTKIDADKGLQVLIVTDKDNKNITEIRVGGKKGKN
jgi:hypothetical protein